MKPAADRPGPRPAPRAGTKTVLFRGALAIGNNQDVLLLTVPDPASPGAIETLVKIEGTPGANELAGQ